MPFREKVKRVLRSHSHSNNHKPSTNGNGVKIEYYKRHEIPRSKFRGPFDPEHQKRLAAWNFQTAQEDRSRSPDLSLSPCATLPQTFRPPTSETSEVSREMSDAPEDIFDNSPTVAHDEYADRHGAPGSQSSTAVDSDSFNASVMALPLDRDRNDSIACIKESIRYPSPVQTKSKSKSALRKDMPFAPEDLSRALGAVQIA